MPQITFDEVLSVRLDVWLSQKLGRSRSFIQSCCKLGRIKVNQKIVKASFLLRENDVLDYDLTEEISGLPTATEIAIDVIYEDTDILVINKPSGLTVHPGAGNKTHTLVNALLFHEKKLSQPEEIWRPGIVHRLDKDTSGLIVVAKNNLAHERLALAFRERHVEKVYLALVEGRLDEKEGTIELPIGRHSTQHKKFAVLSSGKPARTDYKVLHEQNEKSLVEIQLHTGRTHQIRVHFSALSHPLVGDPLYGKRLGKSQLLHAWKLSFHHPMTQKPLHFTAPPPRWAKAYV
ncbi:MAG: RluA family pseudouridine synthase [Candidatus Margulisiibacteriota bacterium]